MELGLGLIKVAPLIIYIGSFIVVFLTLFYRIEVGILYLVPLLPLQSILDRMQQYPGGKDFIDILLLALVVRWFINKRKAGKSIFIKTSFNLPILILVLWTYIELWLGSSNFSLSLPIQFQDARLKDWKNFMVLPLIYFIITNNVNDRNFIKLLTILMALSMAAMDVSFYNNFTEPEEFTWGAWIGGTFSYLGSNELASFYAMNTMILISLFLFDASVRRKVLFFAVAIFNLYCIIFLYSRGGYLATLVGFAYLGLVKNKKIFVALVVFLLFWKAFLPLSVIQRIEMTQTESGYDQSIEERLSMWEKGKQIFLQHPVIGVGYGTTPYLGITDDIVKHRRRSLHNQYLQTAMELGVIGLSISMWLYILGIRAGWRLYKVVDEGFFKGLGIGLTAYVLAILVSNISGTFWRYLNVMGFYWVFLAFVVRTRIDIEQKVKTELRPVPRRCEESYSIN